MNEAAYAPRLHAGCGMRLAVLHNCVRAAAAFRSLLRLNPREYTAAMGWIDRIKSGLGRMGIPLMKKQEAALQAFEAEYSSEPGADKGSEGRLRTLGTFGGVFTPSFLTIIGVIMYLRFSWVLSNAGLLQTLLIVLLANSITFITALSVASIASNERMQTGGAYFMVSRVLGFQAGGGIGIPLYLSQSLSIALYIIGFAESLNALFPQWPIRIISLVSLGVLTIVSLFGAGLMVRLQYVILAVIALSFVSIAAGFRIGGPVLIGPGYQDGQSFWTVFAVFFPAVTGLLAGVSMSGDLKDPARNIPRGTLASVLAGFVIYMLVPVMLAFTMPDRQALLSGSALTEASRWPILVSLGVFGATLSSAIGSLMGAPRTLQALGIDGAMPSFLGKGVGKTSEPLAALGVSLALAFGVLLIGSLNLIAEVLTMFFLTTYGVLNFSAAMERLVDNPSFRPALRVHWAVNLAGALSCFAVMFLISVVSTLIALGLVAAVFLFLHFRSSRVPGIQSGLWEGFWTSVFFRVSRRIEKTQNSSGKNWRPMIQVFASELASHAELIETAIALSGRGGSLSAYALIDPVQRSIKDRLSRELEILLTDRGARNAHVTVIETGEREQGVLVASQASGFGGVFHNTVMLGLPSTGGRNDLRFLEMLSNLIHINRNILLFKRGRLPWTGNRGPIQVWWGGQETNVRLMLILAEMISRNHEHHRSIQLVTVVGSEEQKDSAREKLEASLKDLRISGQARILVNTEGLPIPGIIQRESERASLVLLGMARPASPRDRGYLEQLRHVSGNLGATLFVMHNISDLDYE